MAVIGFIGFGEASSLITEGLLREGIKKVFAYDANANDLSMGGIIHERARSSNVILTETLKELTIQCNIIICATSSKTMESIAENVKMDLTPDHLYVDINAASSKAKENVSNHIKECGAKFIDGAVMGPIPVKKHRTPIYLSGDGAQRFQEFGTRYGMELIYISEQPGVSSAIKMFRSVFMKGLTTLLWETLESSHQYGVTDYVIASINESISGQPIIDLANTLLPRTPIHAKRRVTEMEEVIKTLDALKVDATLSTAVKEKLSKIVDLNLMEDFDQQDLKHYSDILKVLSLKRKETT